MSCNVCTKSYGFFTKEAGCPNCGFSFCTKCLKKSIAVPRLANKPHRVCLTCFDRLTKEKTTSTSQPHPPDVAAGVVTAAPAAISSSPDADALLLAEDATQPPAAEVLLPISADEAIRQRLERLKEARLNDQSSQPSQSSDQAIAIRIANLKDQPYIDGTRRDPSILLATDQRTDQEKMHDLLQQFEAEAQLDAAADPVADIERRLRALRGTESKSGEGKSAQTDNYDTVSISEEDQVKTLVARYMAEAALVDADGDAGELELTAEEKAFVANVKPPVADVGGQQDDVDGGRSEGGVKHKFGPLKDDGELPWCVICNEDAELRYQGDLFCKTCYREVREDE